MPALFSPRPMRDFDPTQAARLHEQVNDRIDLWPGVSLDYWREHASWHDPAETVINFDGLLYDGWEAR
jgi:hypothetical protein